jgi:hypothetical protein
VAALASGACSNDFDALDVGAATMAGSGGSSASSSGQGAQGAAGSVGGGGGAGVAGSGGLGAVGGSGGMTGACPIREVTDDFEDGTIDGAKWTVDGATVEETGGMLEITPPADTVNADVRLASSGTFDLRGCSIDVEVVDVLPASTVGPTTLKAVAAGNENWLRIGVVASAISFSRKVNGFNDYLIEIPYDPGPHRHWRISEDAGTASFWTAPDGEQWTLQFEAPTPSFASAVKVQISAGTYTGVADPGTARFDSVNKAP